MIWFMKLFGAKYAAIPVNGCFRKVRRIHITRSGERYSKTAKGLIFERDDYEILGLPWYDM